MLLGSRLLLEPAQGVTGTEEVKFSIKKIKKKSFGFGERVKVSVKNKKVFGCCWSCVKSDCLTNLGDFL